MKPSLANETRQGTSKGQGDDLLRARHRAPPKTLSILVSVAGIAFWNFYCRGILEPLIFPEWLKNISKFKINIVLPLCGNAPLLGSELFLLQQRIRTITKASEQISDLQALEIEFRTSTSSEAFDSCCICYNLSPTLGDLEVILQPMTRLCEVAKVSLNTRCQHAQSSCALTLFEAELITISKDDVSLSKVSQTENEWEDFVDQHYDQMNPRPTNRRACDSTALYKKWLKMKDDRDFEFIKRVEL
ncbi:MAG: hypothetical protein LQ351_007641 [Letrouitia transgressa]|nr:MAG: hypothetical protein LQ351_007641 [Letrouitia transgressa]